jgi:hypothetical protein
MYISLREADREINKNYCRTPLLEDVRLKDQEEDCTTIFSRILKEQDVKREGSQISTIALKIYLNPDKMTMIMIIITIWKNTNCVIKRRKKRNLKTSLKVFQF